MNALVGYLKLPPLWITQLCHPAGVSLDSGGRETPTRPEGTRQAYMKRCFQDII